MPMSRYQIRNEYALADSELYTAGDRDDPEALLEAVAMAGLVGVLRQLGDLAEFAAEIFHDLHEEVMVTAARGHGLMARVQQLEAEFPSIEKAFLSQTNHSSFFSSAGVDWHPNLCTKQNLITSGDMPRFVMDSYEECRGPPRLFLLDKFDVAGAGACLKRYTDPSFFKTEPLSSKIETVDITREKKNRKVKKKGSRWKNGETPEVAPPSHAKLHQLFLEERIENGHSDPARVVRLKRRQLNGFPFDLKPEKSYMEKFLETSSPEHKAICDVSVISPALKLTYDNSSESGPEILEINTLSPVKMPSQGKESCCSSPDAQKVVVNPFAGELNGETIGRAIMRVPDPVADGETDESSSTVHKMEIGKELLIDADGKTEVSVDGEHSDSVASEVENYMDALTNMESEMETDYEPKTKQHQGPSNVGKYGTDSEADDEQLDDRTNFSDSPSVGVSSLSDDVNSLLKKGRSNFSCSDYSRLHDEGADEVFPSAENSLVEIVSDQLSHQSAFVDTLGMDSSEIVVSSDFCTDKSKIPDLEEASCSPQLTDLNMLLPSAAAAASSLIVSVGPDSNDTPSHSVKHHFNSPGSNDGGTYTADCSVALSDVSQTRQETPCPVSSQTNPLAELDHEDPNILLDANVHWANVLEMASEKQGSELVNELLQTDYSDETSFWNLAEEEFGSSGLIAPSAEEQFTFSALPGLELDSGAILLPKNSESKLPNAIDSEVSDARADLLPVDLDLAEVAVPSSDENLKLEELSKEKYGENLGGFTIKVDAVGRDALLFEHPSDGSDKPSCVDLVNWDDVASKTGKAEDVALSSGAGAGGTNDDNANGTGCPSSDVDDSPCAKITDIRESLLISEDSCQKQLDLNQTFSPGLLTELEVQKGVEQPDPSPTYYDSSPLMVESSDHGNQEVIDHAHDLCLMGQTSNSLAASDITKPKSSECSNRELESKSTCYSDFVAEDTNPIISPTCSLSEASSLEQQAPELPPYQANAECVHAVADEAISKSLNLPASPKGYIEELRSPLEHLSQSPAYQLDSVCVQENEASSFPSDVQLEQMQTADNLNSERSLDASSLSFLEGVPSRGILAKSISQQLDGFKVVRKTVDSVFPSLSPLPKAAHADLEDLPPLPPLPPMQWRLGKVLSAQLTLERQQVPVIQGTVSPMPLLTSKENAELEILSPGGLIWRPSSPSLPISAAESQRPQHNISEESTGHSLQQALPCSETISSHNEATSHQDCISLEGTQSLSPLLNLLDTTSKKPEHDFTSLKGDFIQFRSDMPFQVPSLEQTTSGRDPAVVVVPLIDPLSHLESGTVVETRLTSEILEGEQGNSPDKSMKPVSLLEEQSQCDVVASQGERTLPSNTLSLPANYLVGMPNGNKFPRPRNPLIDAVAAHDKTKLRKVTERVRHQIEPKVDDRFALQLRKVTERVRHQIEPKDDERDSLLEQIRTKSFNLKRATVTRPTIQAVQGPQTNLNVAAILEKANAIRQALTGSDEDDESDSWSDN